MRRSRRVMSVLLVMAAASLAIASHLPAPGGDESADQHSRLLASAVSSRLEVPLVQVKSFDGHEQHRDNDGRRIELGIVADVAAFAVAGLVAIIRRNRTSRFEPAMHGDVRVRAPPVALTTLTYSAAHL